VIRGAAAAGIVLAFCLAACRSRAPAAEKDAGALASGVSATSACDASASCGANDYCAFTPRLCGKGKRPGACTPKPDGCSDTFTPVCGCDFKMYPNECQAHSAGVDLAVNGGCREKVPDWLLCGSHYCDARTSYCEIVLSDVFELPTDWTCKPLPATCTPGGASCDCFPKGTHCLGFCVSAETGGLPAYRLTCRS
jgi:hypothetical protein